jgi:acetyl esterase/lipase
MRRFSPLLSAIVILLVGSAVILLRPSGAAQEATPIVETEVRVPYGEPDGVPLELNVFLPPGGDAPHPAVLLFPAWSASRFDMTEPATELAKVGYVAFAVSYRLGYPEFVDDAQLAVRWVRANADRYGVDPERLCAYGLSAGGQLAAMLAVRETRDEGDPALPDYSSRVACAVDLAGLTDLTILEANPEDQEWVTEQLGGTVAEVPEAYRDLSPVAFVDAQSAPMLVIHGLADTVTPIEHPRRLLAALQDAGVEVVYAELAGERHLSVGDWTRTGPLVLAFLDRHLDPER